MTLPEPMPQPRRRRHGPGPTVALVLVIGSLTGAAQTSAAPMAGPGQPSATTPPVAAGGQTGCQEASSTIAMQECLERQLRQVDREMERYFERAQRRLGAEQDLPGADAGGAAAELVGSQKAWRRYRDRQCQAVWRFWSGGTIRGTMALLCHIQMARERQHRLWADFLTFPDGSPALLPEPPSATSGGRP